jgi:hypothetical protein
LEPLSANFTGTTLKGRKPGSYKWYEIQIELDQNERTKLITLVNRVNDWKTGPDLSATLGDEISIGQLVYELYGLNEEDIALVEGAVEIGSGQAGVHPNLLLFLKKTP